MKIYKDGINKNLWETLLKFQNEPLFKNYHLVGGTALTLQIGHRISDDIDLFTTEKLNKEKIFSYAQTIDKKAEVLNDSNTIYQLYFPSKGLKIDFVHYPYMLIDPIITTNEGLHIVGKNDISAMKMSATGTRGYEAKDFVDLFYLLKEIPIEKIIENFNKKYESENPLHYIRSMAYFEDVTLDSWKNIKMISDNISINEIKNTLINNVRNYEKQILVMNNKQEINLNNNIKPMTCYKHELRNEVLIDFRGNKITINKTEAISEKENICKYECVDKKGKNIYILQQIRNNNTERWYFDKNFDKDSAIYFIYSFQKDMLNNKNKEISKGKNDNDSNDGNSGGGRK